LPNGDELETDSMRISRHSKIKVMHDGELPADIGLKMGGYAVAYTVLSDVDGEAILKPNMPMHNLEEYELGDSSFTVKAPGDINGDGFSDFVAGAPVKPNFGKAYAIYGKDTLDYSTTVSNASSVAISSNVPHTKFGMAVALGDINGDGYADIAIGAPEENQGCAYVFHGSSSLQGSLIADGTEDVRVCRVNGDPSKLGMALAFGDVNGDGFEDLLIGEPYADGFDNINTPSTNEAGVVHAIFGGTSVASQIDFDGQQQPQNTATFYLSASHRQHLGWSLASPDINGDGIDDIAIGAPHEANANKGRIYVGMGSADIESQQIDGGLSAQNVDQLGWSVAVRGDLNNDRKEEILIGAKSKLFVYRDGLSSPVTIAVPSQPAPTGLLIVSAFQRNQYNYDLIGDPSLDLFIKYTEGVGLSLDTGLTNSEFGCAISPVGDLDRDGEPDYVVGAKMAAPQARGRLFINIDDEEIMGESNSQLGTAVAGGRIR